MILCGFAGKSALKSLLYQAFFTSNRQGYFRPFSTKVRFVRKSRKPLAFTGTWVRIPPAPPKQTGHPAKGVRFVLVLQDSNPRALGKVPGALCHPRRPTPQRRSNPTRSAINTGFYAFFVKHPNRRFPRMVCQSRSALPDSRLSAESRAFRFAVYRDDLFLHNPHSPAVGSIIAPWVIIKGSCQIDKNNAGESARDCRLSCVFVCW